MTPGQVAPLLAVVGVGCGREQTGTVDDLERAIYAEALSSASTDDLTRASRLGAERALRDAGYAPDRWLPIAVVVVDGCTSAEVATNDWDIDGPLHITPNLGQALTATRLLLSDDALEAVLIVDGAAAMVCATDTCHRVYATIDAISIRNGRSFGASDALRSALASAGARAQQIGYIEFCPSDGDDGDLQALRDLASVWSVREPRRAAVSCFGKQHVSRFSLLLAIIKAALCLHYGYRPSWFDHDDDQLGALRESGLVALRTSLPWIRDSREDALRSAVGGYDSLMGAHVYVVLRGGNVRGDVVHVDWQSAGGPMLLPVGGLDVPDLLRRIRQVGDALTDGADPWGWIRDAGEHLAQATHRVVLCAAGIDAMRKEVDAALALLPKMSGSGRDWVTPSGSCYTPAAIGPTGKVALVYPGGLSAYPGLAMDLHRCFPGLVLHAEAQGGLPRGYFAQAQPLYEDTEFSPNAVDPLDVERRLHRDFATVLNVGLGFGFLQTHALRSILGVPVHGAFGYSLGEITMLYSLGTRPRVDPNLDQDDGLFRERLGGPKTAIRELWGISDSVPDDDVWTTMVLFADADVVRVEVSRHHERVFLTHINTPSEVVIAGDPTECRAVMQALECPGLSTAVSYVLHCPAVDQHAMHAYIEHRLGPVKAPVDGVELFSGDHGAPLLSFNDAARTAAGTLRRTVDFPRLVESLYQNGYRYFIETGPGATASRWIGEILDGKPHLAISADRRGAGTAAGTARVLARLASHGVRIDLSKLTGTTTNKEIPCPTL